jgi:hypothetical protein
MEAEVNLKGPETPCTWSFLKTRPPLFVKAEEPLEANE